MNPHEHEAQPHDAARESDALPDHGQIVPASMERTLSRFQARIIEGITAATAAGREIDAATARTIAYVLGRAFGRQSALAEFGRSGEGTYEALRDEYLTLYTDQTTPPQVKEWINWFGTYLVQVDATGSGRRFMGPGPVPDLERLLVRTTIYVGGVEYVVHAPATLTPDRLAQLVDLVAGYALTETSAVWAFLTLPDVNIADPNLLESFHDSYIGEFATIDETLYGLTELTEWEAELKAFAEERGILPDAISIDLDVIENQTRDIYDLVETGGTIYAFNR